MEEFIKTLTDQMRCVKARDSVARELSDHIADQTEAYEQSGMEHNQAVEKAVREMGDPVEIGVSMDRIHRPQIDWKMLLITFVLSIAGFLCMTPMYGFEHMKTSQILFTLIGFAVITLVYFIDYSMIGCIGAIAYIVMTVLFFILKKCLPMINGRQTAMFILVYLYVPLFAGILYQLRKGGYKSVILGFAVIGITFAAVLYLSNNFVAAVNIFLMMAILLITAVVKGMFGKNKKYITMMAAVAVILPVIASFWYINRHMATYQIVRLNAFFHRDQFRTNNNYVYGVIEDVLKNAKLIGTGTSKYAQENHFLAFSEGELLPLAVIYSYGIIAAVLLFILLAVFILRAMKIVRGQKNQLGFLVSMACLLVLSVNCLEGILVGVGLFPVVTVAIPFLTRGGSTVIVYSIIVGLLLSIHRYEKVYTREIDVYQPRWRVSLKVERR
ncbi:MAG: FtsW/RodA/SpoVE family cell cycle protein [Lachnospiraceae bacterium]|nr:FtsW/RodA/SpoVE family cell cycle protein [Lachnospiraceae bacterium]